MFSLKAKMKGIHGFSDKHHGRGDNYPVIISEIYFYPIVNIYEKEYARGGTSYLKKHKLNFRYHNPNGNAETAEYIARIFIEASKIKFEKVLQESPNTIPGNDLKKTT